MKASKSQLHCPSRNFQHSHPVQQTVRFRKNLISSVFFIRSKYMVNPNVEIPSSFDAFAETKSSLAVKGNVHLRIQQRNGRKCLTTVQGLKEDFSYQKILKDLKKEFCCNGNVVNDKELGKVIQLQGDQRLKVMNFLVKENLVDKDHIKIHGF